MIRSKEQVIQEAGAIEALSPYQLFQLEKYGNVIAGGGLVQACELENGRMEAEYFAAQVDNYFELQIIEA